MTSAQILTLVFNLITLACSVTLLVLIVRDGVQRRAYRLEVANLRMRIADLTASTTRATLRAEEAVALANRAEARALNVRIKADASSFRSGPMGESQPVTDHSGDPLVPEVLK